MGLFWNENETRHLPTRPQPYLPDTGWRMPKALPRLWEASAIAFDVETFDPALLTQGPGWARGSGHVVGFALGTPDGFRAYYPLRHRTGENFAPDKILPWLRQVMETPHIPKVGANLLYDVGWMRAEGVQVQGPLHDVQFAEALLTESGKTNLEHLGQKYLGAGKESTLLYTWLAEWFGEKPSSAMRKHIHAAPASLVGPYAASDVELPLRIMEKQWPLLAAEGLLDVFHMECRLIPLLLEMRAAGVSVDIDRAEQLYDELGNRAEKQNAELSALVGFPVNVNAAASLAQAWKALGLRHETSATGKPSFTKPYLQNCPHPVAAKVVDIRKTQKLRDTFLKSYILDAHVDGKVFCQFHPLRGGTGGTRSGRFASSKPNLQNVPSRDEELAPLIRGLFVPDAGHVGWKRFDYSQIEYRFLAHYATGPGAEDVRARYAANPNTDYHKLAQDMVSEMTGLELKRKPAKTISFGLIYGMGVAKLIRSLGLTDAPGKKLFEAYHRAMPFVKTTMQAAVREAETTGAIRTILGRKSRFDLWEPSQWSKNTLALPYEKALAVWGGDIRLAHTHKALNRKLQGSAADLMKVAMLRAWDDGLFDVLGVPRLTIHDELDFSDAGAPADAWEALAETMNGAIPLRVPVLVDGETGPDWGHCV